MGLDGYAALMHAYTPDAELPRYQAARRRAGLDDSVPPSMTREARASLQTAEEADRLAAATRDAKLALWGRLLALAAAPVLTLVFFVSAR